MKNVFGIRYMEISSCIGEMMVGMQSYFMWLL